MTPDDVIVKKKTRFGLDAISNVDDGTTNETEFDAFDDDDDGFATKTTEARQKETPLKSAVSFTRRQRTSMHVFPEMAFRALVKEETTER